MPVDPFQGFPLDLANGFLDAEELDDLSFGQADDAFGQSIVIGISDAAACLPKARPISLCGRKRRPRATATSHRVSSTHGVADDPLRSFEFSTRKPRSAQALQPRKSRLVHFHEDVAFELSCFVLTPFKGRVVLSRLRPASAEVKGMHVAHSIVRRDCLRFGFVRRS